MHPAVTATAIAVLLLLGTVTSTEPEPGTPVTSRRPARHSEEHRYRILGKVRFLLFWAGRDNVGTARMSVHADGPARTLTFLVGSDPDRAPRNLNEWSYLREELSGTDAQVFAMGSVEAGAGTMQPEDSLRDSFLVTTSCAAVSGGSVRTVQTAMVGRDLTYRTLDRALDRAAASERWQRKTVNTPAGAVVGFLSAVQHVIRAGRTNPQALKAGAPIAYVYNNLTYELTVRDTERIGRARIGERVFDRLLRTEFGVRRTNSRQVSRFAVTYVSDADGSVLPVQIFYQPSFWLRIELRLDDAADAPADPAAGQAALARIREICAAAR